MALPPVNPEGRALFAPLAWTGVVLALARVPACVGIVPVLGVFRGPAGVLLLALALALAGAAALPAPRRIPASPRLLFGLAWLFLVVVGLSYTLRLRVSGDEPHYLLMAQSLWRDHDLDLRNNFEHEDFLEYTPGPLVPHYGAPRADGRPFPAHSPGLPLLLAPVYALGGRLACVVLLTLAAALLAEQCRVLALRLTADPSAAVVSWAIALGPPVFFYSFHVYTEVPSALALALGLRLILGAPGLVGAALAALTVSALPWLHVKMIPAAAALGLVAVWRLRGRPRVAFLAVAILMGAGFLGYYTWIFGRATPLALYGGLPQGQMARPSPALLGLLLDRSFGLLPHAPVFLVALAGLPFLLRARRSDGFAHLVVATAVLAPILGWRMWWGGQCPPGRFLVPLVPSLAVAASARLAAGRQGLARLTWPLWSCGMALAVYMSADPGRLLLLNRGDRPTRVWAALAGHVDLSGYLPGLTLPERRDWQLAAIWMAVLSLVLVLDRWGVGGGRKTGDAPPSASPGSSR